MVVARVTRTLLARWRVGQLLAPVGVGIGVIARRAMSTPLIVAAGLVYLATAVAFLSARRSFRRVEVRGENRGKGGALTFVLNGVPVDLTNVGSWTFDRGRARIYDRQGGWSLRGDDPKALEAVLSHALGPPLRLQRRGSAWARRMALVVAGLGAAVLVAGAAVDNGPLVVLGVLAFVYALATFAFLSRKVSVASASPDLRRGSRG